MIEIEDVSKTFTSGDVSVHAVKDVTLHIDKGDIYGIIGFSGAGKSTLVRCINLLERPTTGKVTVDGQELTSLSAKELRDARKNIGMIFQHFNLLGSRTVFENVAFPLKKSGKSKEEIATRVRELLAYVDISDKEDAYPSQLSGGQKQRVAIARALANDPHVLLCDEATSALDPQTTKSILELLKRLNTELNLTIVVITHEMAVVKAICNKVAVMDNGEVVEAGDVYDVFANPHREITQNFISTTSNLHKIYDLSEDELPEPQPDKFEKLVRLSFSTRSTTTPVISTLSREYNVDFNVLFSDIDIVAGATLGGSVGILSGTREAVRDALIYLDTQEIGVEVLDR